MYNGEQISPCVHSLLKPYGVRILVPQSNYFQSCDLMSALCVFFFVFFFSTHIENEETLSGASFILLPKSVHSQQKLFKHSFQGEIRMALSIE